MKSSAWQAVLLIAIAIGGNVCDVCIYPRSVFAQSNQSQKAEAEELFKSYGEEFAKGNFPQSLVLLQRALPLFQATKNRSRECETLNGLGMTYIQLGEPRTAIYYLEKSLKISREIKDRGLEGGIFGSLGVIYDGLGEYSTAIKYLQQSLKIIREVGDPKTESTILINFANVYKSQRKYLQSIDYFKQSLKISREIQSANEEVASLNGLGTMYLYLRQYSNAIDYYQQSLKIIQKIGKRDAEATILNNLGGLYENLGQYQTSINYLQKSLTISQSIGLKYLQGQTLGNLGSVYEDLEKYQKAIDYFQQSLKVMKEMKNLDGESIMLNNLGYTYQKLENYSQSVKYYEQSLAIKKDKLHNRAGEGIALLNIGGIYGNMKQKRQEIDLYQQALKISREEDHNFLEEKALESLAVAHYELNQISKATEYLQQSVAIKDTLLVNLSDKNKISLFQQQVNSYKALSLFQHRQNKLSESLIASERGRTRAFQDLLAQKQNFPKPTAPTFTQLQNIARHDRSTIVEYSIIPKFGKSDPRPQDELFIYIITPDGKLTVRTQPLPKSLNLSQLVATNREQMINTDPNIASRGQPPSISTLRIGQSVRVKVDSLNSPSRQIIKLDPQTKMVEVSGLSDDVKSDLVAVEQIIPLAQPQNTRYSSSQQLHKILIEPIADLLPKNLNSPVIFIPDGALFEVPFVALQDARGNYLIDKHTILTAPSLGVLIQTAKLKPSGNNALVVGNPVMPKPREVYLESNWNPLPNSQIEANQVAKILNAQPSIGSQATETAIKSQLSQYRVIHLATHGSLVSKAVGDSAIVLAAGGNDDGYLTVDEILDLKLNADLVVLSACNTGRGDIQGDGIVGLSRALMTAGTRSLIVSLWGVNDRSTSELMQEFYRQWRGEKSKAQALREAMMVVRQKYPAPYHWAGMTLMGEAK